MSEQPDKPRGEGEARRMFHLALVLGVLLFLAYALLLPGAARDRSESGLVWRRRLYALFFCDVVLTAALVLPGWLGMPSPTIPEVGIDPELVMAASDACRLPSMSSVGPRWWLPFVLFVPVAGWAAFRGTKPFSPWGWLFTLAVGAAVFITPSTVLYVLCLGRGEAAPLDFLAATILPFGVLGLAAALAMRRTSPSRWASERALSHRSAYVRGLLYAVASVLRIGAVLAVANGLFPGLLDDVTAAQRLNEAVAGAGGIIGVSMTVLIAVLGPLAEEAAFRGALLPWLGRRLPPEAAIVLSSILFAAMHVTYGIGVLTVLPLGLVFGWTRWRTGSLTVPIALHMTWNVLLLLRSVLLG